METKKICFEQMELIEGGFDMGTAAGAACGAAVSGFLFGGLPGVFTSLTFGPTCLGLTGVYIFG